MSTTVLAALARLYLLLAVGWLLRRTGQGGPHVADGLTVAVTEVTMPALIVATLVRRPAELAMVGAVGVAWVGLGAALAAATAVAHWVAPGPEGRSARGTFLVCTTFCNTGFLGIPLAQALWGEGSAGLSTAVMVDSFTTTLLLNTVGVALALHHSAGGRFDRAALGRLARAPMFLAVPVGLVLGQLPIPTSITDLIADIGAPTAALVFLATGMRLRFDAVLRSGRALVATTLIRFGIAPAVAVAAAYALRLHGEIAQEAVLEVAMPTALMAPVISARYGCDPELGPALVAVTTALAPVAIVLWLAITDALVG